MTFKQGILLTSACAVSAFLALSMGSAFFHIVGERLENQRESRFVYSCQRYGAAMNKHYGAEVCPEEFSNQKERK